MNNDGRFKAGRKVTKAEIDKRIVGQKRAWKSRSDYHGMCGTRFHVVWRSMTTRCRGTAGPDSIKKYKDKGITVCEKWLKFKGFYEDMYPTYEEGKTIDRIENSKGYFKENCRWATYQEQANNKTNNLLITYNGKSQTLRYWSNELGVSFAALRCRYYKQFMKGSCSIEHVFRQ